MRARARRTRHGVFALAILLLGVVATPVVDAWLHAGTQTAAAHDEGERDCGVCWLGHASASRAPEPPRLVAREQAVSAPVPVAATASRRPAATWLAPPSRAPPLL